MAPDRQVRVMVVDDHEIMRDGLREVLERSGNFEVVGQAGDGVAAVNIAMKLKPDVIVMDVMMPLKNGIDACREITEMLPDTRVLILTASAEEDAAIEAVAASVAYRAASCEACSREYGERLNRRRPTVQNRSHNGTGRF